MKREYLFPVAEKMFVEEGRPQGNIAAELKLSIKTVQLWKKKGDWENKRARLAQSSVSMHENIQRFAVKIMNLLEPMMEKQEKALKNKEKISEDELKLFESRINSLTKLLSKLTSTRIYEASEAQEQKAAAKKELSKDELKAKISEILGG